MANSSRNMAHQRSNLDPLARPILQLFWAALIANLLTQITLQVLHSLEEPQPYEQDFSRTVFVLF